MLTREEEAARTLAEQIKDSFAENAQEFLKAGNAECSWIADMLGAALSEVNWDEIAQGLIESAKEADENGEPEPRSI